MSEELTTQISQKKLSNRLKKEEKDAIRLLLSGSEKVTVGDGECTISNGIVTLNGRVISSRSVNGIKKSMEKTNIEKKYMDEISELKKKLSEYESKTIDPSNDTKEEKIEKESSESNNTDPVGERPEGLELLCSEAKPRRKRIIKKIVKSSYHE